jgi:hypothetical protein
VKSAACSRARAVLGCAFGCSFEVAAELGSRFRIKSLSGASRAWAGIGSKLESLILAQNERWRRA